MSFNNSVECNVVAFETDVQLRYIESTWHISTTVFVLALLSNVNLPLSSARTKFLF